jgi:hypothetical protein
MAAPNSQAADPALGRAAEFAPLAQAVCEALRSQVERLGFAPGSVPIADPGAADYRLDKDPASGADSLIGTWRDARGQKVGGLVFHADGSFFVEYDVVRPHPTRPSWFVEAAQAWGRGGDIRAEPRLLPMPS